ncbi:DNA topology modulation protein FlaR [Sporolactobacillus pectinivorans]|uniref:DNA topology modulation protein FlaR n=1 Tax=Sporolactobacillus pectinivorans TaxID=1591408 RepID=UPI000C26211D|nr:DNA topology modulation protein FlaR [Sporolactobacillus pectinivorans]
MKKIIPNKIHIIGSVGSGKTTLARNLSHQFNIPFYELDNVIWTRNVSGDIRRTDEERDKLLSAIIRSDTWIIEGVHFHNWIFPSFDHADLIIFLDTVYSKRKFRIIKRFIRQKFGFEKANYKPTFKLFKDMFKWNATFESQTKPELKNMLSQRYKDKTITLRDDIDIHKFFN